jgi:hypothetical protein
MNLEQDLQQVREKWIDIVTERNREKKWHLCVHTHPHPRERYKMNV